MTDAPKEIWTTGGPNYGSWNANTQGGGWIIKETHYTRTGTIPQWSSDMDAAPVEGVEFLARNPNEGVKIVYDINGTLYCSVTMKPAFLMSPNEWKHIDLPKEGE